ncbi:MAG: chalcone isomerase family protein [Rhodocyclaceae bacterium]|nr:chalcone isomerase family protein [Rhodocyclaceae bacterium]
MAEIDEIKAGTSIVFDWIPEKGTLLTIGGQMKGKEIAGEDFFAGLLKVWLGEDPAQDDLKQALLGKSSR